MNEVHIPSGTPEGVRVALRELSERVRFAPLPVYSGPPPDLQHIGRQLAKAAWPSLPWGDEEIEVHTTLSDDDVLDVQVRRPSPVEYIVLTVTSAPLDDSSPQV